jgi:hypothetical protein
MFVLFFDLGFFRWLQKEADDMELHSKAPQIGQAASDEKKHVWPYDCARPIGRRNVSALRRDCVCVCVCVWRLQNSPRTSIFPSYLCFFLSNPHIFFPF